MPRTSRRKTRAGPIRRVTIHRPEIEKHSVRISWQVDPPSDLYRTTEFFLRFPDFVDLSGVPEYLWWVIVPACLHPQWLFLRPCRVEFPVAIPRGALEFWTRFLEAQFHSLETYREPRERGESNLEIELSARGRRLALPGPLPESGRCATTFSGGKDSLLQAGLLAELTTRPVLVATTSPMPPLQDHQTARRRYVMREIARRRDVTLVEVLSDFRSSWDTAFPRRLGYPVNLNEVTDTHLYVSTMIAAGYALGCARLFIASETEVQETAVCNGHIVYHLHMMYALAFLRSIDRLLAPAGLRLDSLTSSLHSFQVQELLWRRYPDISDLQYSCWRAAVGQAACNACSQCLRLAMYCLAMGRDPQRMGIDLAQLLAYGGEWQPKPLKASEDSTPQDVLAEMLEAQLIRAVRATPLWRVGRALVLADPRCVLRRSTREALRGYARLRRTAARWEPGPRPGYRLGFLPVTDERLRARLQRIFGRYFHAEPPACYKGLVDRSERVQNDITQPLYGEPEPGRRVPQHPTKGASRA